MRFHSIEAIALDIPLTRNFGGSTYAVLKRSTVVTRLRTDDGLVSEVYNGDNREHGLEIVRLIHEELAPLLRGQDLFEGERIWDRLFALTHSSRDRKTLMEAIACVDCAIWDLVGKARGQSVCALLGGAPPRRCPSSRSAATTARARPSPTSAARWRATAQAGMAGCKFKVGGLAPGGRRGAGRRGPRAPRAPTSSWRWTPTAAGRWRTRCASRASSSRSTSAGSRSPATGTTTPA